MARYGSYRTPQMARRQRIYDWLCVAALGLIVVTTFAIAALVVALLS